jgi:hypothetical protein
MSYFLESNSSWLEQKLGGVGKAFELFDLPSDTAYPFNIIVDAQHYVA